MEDNNRAFLFNDYNTLNEGTTMKKSYLGGTLEFDVELNEVECACAAGVFLTALDGDKCRLGTYDLDEEPQCATIDLMEANRYGFNAASHPCVGGQCDLVSQCAVKASDQGENAYGPSDSFTINTQKKYSVKTRFWADSDFTGTPNNL